jgi:hypothetical protein
VSECGKSYEACAAQVKPCFAHKMRYMRENGVGVARPGEVWRAGTIKEQQDDIVKRAKQNGYDPQPVGSRWV